MAPSTSTGATGAGMFDHVPALLSSDQGPFALLGTLFIAWVAQRNLRRGQHDTREIEADKREIERDKIRFEQGQQLLEGHRQELARVRADRQADEERCRRDLERVEARHTAERDMCAQTTRRLHDDLVAVASALRSEVDKATALEAADRAETHRRVEHEEGQP